MNLESFITFIMVHRWRTILLSLLAILILATGARHIIMVDVDIRNHFGSDNPHIMALDQLESTYAISDTVLIAMAPQNGTIFTRDNLVAIEELTERLWLTPYTTRVDSLVNYSHSEGFEDELIVGPLIENALSLGNSEVQRIEHIALNAREVVGRLISRDGRVAGLLVSLTLPDEDRQLSKDRVVDFLNETAAEARANHTNIDYYLTGELFLNRAVRDAIDEDFRILGPLAFGTMLLVAMFVLRSIWGTVAIVMMIFSVVLSALGFAGWTGMRLFGESGAALFVLMAITVAHAVHVIEAILSGQRQGMDRIQATTHSLQLNIWPVFLTSITTAIGFLSLNFSEMPPFRVMGNIVAFGSLCAFIYSVTLLPAFLSKMPMRVRVKHGGESRCFRSFRTICRFPPCLHAMLLWHSCCCAHCRHPAD